MELKEKFTWVFDWYMQDYCGAVLSGEGSRGRATVTREVYNRIEAALVRTADPDNKIRHRRSFDHQKDYWPALLEQAGVEVNLNKQPWVYAYTEFSGRYSDLCKKNHRDSDYKEAKFPDEKFFRDLFKAFDGEFAGKFWGYFCSGDMTDSIEESNIDQAAAYFWLDLTRLAASGSDSEILVHWKKQKVGKLHFPEAPGIQCYKPSIEDRSEEYPLLKEMLDLHGFLKEEQPSFLDELLHLQSPHIIKMQLLNDRSSRPQLPAVIHFQVEGDRGERVVSWAKKGRETEPRSLKEAIREASRWFGEAARDEVLQVAVPPDLARKVFEIVQVNEDIFENLVIPVSGFVLKPRSSTNRPMKPNPDLVDKIWLQTPRPIRDQSEFPAHEVNSKKVKELRRRHRDPILHLHLICEGEPDEEVDRLSTEFDRNLLFVFHKGSNNKTEFDETLYTDGTDVVSIPLFMKTLREFQGKEFSKAPRVFWQHPERECDVLRAVQPQVSG